MDDHRNEGQQPRNKSEPDLSLANQLDDRQMIRLAESPRF